MKRIARVVCRAWLVVCLSCGIACASADSLVLPSMLQSVEEGAFDGCASVTEITLPPSVSSVAAGAFSGTAEALWVHCDPGKVARSLLSSGIDTDAGAVCRALIVSQTYPGSSLALLGPAFDSQAVSSCLSSFGGMDYHVSRRYNLSAAGILSSIQDTFSGATEYDISLFYYSGHGGYSGSLVGTDNARVTAVQLRQALDRIPGRKVLIVDACYSGGILNVSDNASTASALRGETPVQAEVSDSDLRSFNAAFLSAFSGTRLRSASSGAFSQYYIMTSASPKEVCAEGYVSPVNDKWAKEYIEARIADGLIDGSQFSDAMEFSSGYFTYYLCRGCGWNSGLNAPCEPAADSNADGVVTFGEAFTYANIQATRVYPQHAQSNNPSCATFSPFR